MLTKKNKNNIKTGQNQNSYLLLKVNTMKN